VVATIPVGSSPDHVAANPNTNKIYATNQFGDSISVIDGSTNTVTSTIPMAYNPVGIAVNPDTNRVYATSWTSSYASCSLDVIDGSTDTLLTQTPLGYCGDSVAVNPKTNMVYVTSISSGLVIVVDGLTNSIVSRIPVHSNPEGLAVNPVTNRVYVSFWVCDCNHVVDVIDGSTNTVTATVQTGQNGYGIAVNPNANKIYVAAPLSGSLIIIDGSTNTAAGSISVQGYHVAYNPVTNKVYAPSSGNTVAVIDGSTNSITATLVVGNGPWGLDANPATNKVYVANERSNTVSVIDAALTTTSTLTVNTQDTSGVPISGLYVTLYHNNQIIATGYSPATFTLSGTQSYAIKVDDYGNYTFDRWLDTGSTYRNRPVSISSDTSLTAVYQSFNAVPQGYSTISIKTTNSAGDEITGYYVTFWQSVNSWGNPTGLLHECYTHCSYAVPSGQTYYVRVADYGSETFSHWSDGATNRLRAVAVGSTSTNVDLTAVFTP